MNKQLAGLAALAALLFGSQTIAIDSSAIYGAWATHEGGEVTFYDCDEHLCGKITKLRPPDADTPTEDIYNPDPELRSRPLLGLVMFTEFEADSDGKWSGGKLYNTMEGKFYKSKLKLKDETTLEMSGCMMFFCRSFDWLKVDAPEADQVSDTDQVSTTDHD